MGNDAQRHLDTLNVLNSAAHDYLAGNSSNDILAPTLQRLATLTNGLRVSIVRIEDARPDQGMVIASHDNADIEGIVIQLAQYPEIGEAIYSGNRVVVDRTDQPSIIDPVADRVAGAGIRSLAIIPMIIGSSACGTLVLRVARDEYDFDETTIALCELFGSIAGLALERAALLNGAGATPHGSTLAGQEDETALVLRLTEEIARATRYNRPLGVLGLYVGPGIATADMVLYMIRNLIRPTDSVFEYANGRYVVLLPEAEADGVEIKGQIIRESLISDLDSSQSDESEGSRMSLATFGEENPETATTLLARLMDRLETT